MNPAALADLVRTAAVDVLTSRDLDRSALPAAVTIERPRDPAHGDYATNLALQVANLVGVAPRELAGWLATELAGRDGVAAADVAGPGFVNLRIDPAIRGEIVRQVLAAGERYGTGNRLAGHPVTVGLTVNPTGPLHLGVTRQAAAGDALGRVLAAQGAEVTRVCHINDDGAHIDQFVHSLIASARGEPPPEDGYAGTYLSNAAAEVLRREPSALSLGDDDCAEIFRRVGVGLMLDEIKLSLTEFRAEFRADFRAEFRGEPHDTGGQPVRLIRDGNPVLMSNRAGTVVVLDDLVDAVGVDAARYALIRSALDAPLDIDVDAWSRQTDDNPLFSVRYAHTRLAAVARNADDLGIDTAAEPDFALLTDQLDGELIHTLGDFPATVEQAGEAREPHRVARYLDELADTYHRFSVVCRVLPQGDELPTQLTTARLALCAAARQVLANGLRLLGVTAPERM